MYLLDTNILSEVVRVKPNRGVIRKLNQIQPDILYASVITRYEFRFGAELHTHSKTFWNRLSKEVIPLVQWVAMNSSMSEKAGLIAATLQKEGKSAGIADTMIATTALERGFMLVTRNTTHFHGIADLKVENWFK